MKKLLCTLLMACFFVVMPARSASANPFILIGRFTTFIAGITVIITQIISCIRENKKSKRDDVKLKLKILNFKYNHPDYKGSLK